MIILNVRPTSLWLPPALWTQVKIEGDSEESVANLVTSHLLSTRHEVQSGDEDSDPLTFEGDENDED
jgi:hypothetical protein